VVIAGCSASPPVTLVVEYQAAHLLDTTPYGWHRGSTLVVDDSAEFPQPLTVRWSVLDDLGQTLYLRRTIAGTTGSETQLVRGESYCVRDFLEDPPRYCMLEFSVVGYGGSLVVVEAETDSAATRRCEYYAIVPSTGDSAVVRDELEREVADCTVE
jgi:hypothetical protein